MDRLRLGLGQAVRALRHDRALSQERLAEAAGVHRTFVYRLERGDVTVSLDTLQRIARPLSISLSALLAEAERLAEALGPDADAEAAESS